MWPARSGGRGASGRPAGRPQQRGEQSETMHPRVSLAEAEAEAGPGRDGAGRGAGVAAGPGAVRGVAGGAGALRAGGGGGGGRAGGAGAVGAGGARVHGGAAGRGRGGGGGAGAGAAAAGAGRRVPAGGAGRAAHLPRARPAAGLPGAAPAPPPPPAAPLRGRPRGRRPGPLPPPRAAPRPGAPAAPHRRLAARPQDLRHRRPLRKARDLSRPGSELLHRPQVVRPHCSLWTGRAGSHLPERGAPEACHSGRNPRAFPGRLSGGVSVHADVPRRARGLAPLGGRNMNAPGRLLEIWLETLYVLLRTTYLKMDL